MSLKPENAIEELESFGEPSFQHEPDSQGIEMVKYSDGVEFFAEKCIKGRKIKTGSVSVHFPLGIFSEIENGMNVMMDRYYIPHKMCKFLEVRFSFYPKEVSFKEDLKKERLSSRVIKRIRNEMELSPSKFASKIGKNEERLEVIEDIGTRQTSVISSIREEVSRRLYKVSRWSKKKVKCQMRNIESVDEWDFNYDFYDYESGEHIAGYGVNSSIDSIWNYSFITHNMEDEIRVMTRSEAGDYFNRPTVGQ